MDANERMQERELSVSRKHHFSAQKPFQVLNMRAFGHR